MEKQAKRIQQTLEKRKPQLNIMYMTIDDIQYLRETGSIETIVYIEKRIKKVKIQLIEEVSKRPKPQPSRPEIPPLKRNESEHK